MCLKPYTYRFNFRHSEPITVTAYFEAFAKRKAIKQYQLTADNTDLTADFLTGREYRIVQTIMFNADLKQIIRVKIWQKEKK